MARDIIDALGLAEDAFEEEVAFPDAAKSGREGRRDEGADGKGDE